MIDEFIDLSPLDPMRDPERVERLVRAISARAADALTRARLRHGVMGQIAAWRAPMLAAAAVIALASGLVLAQVRITPAAPAPTPQIAEAVGVPVPVAQWMRSGELPTIGDLLTAFGGQ